LDTDTYKNTTIIKILNEKTKRIFFQYNLVSRANKEQKPTIYAKDSNKNPKKSKDKSILAKLSFIKLYSVLLK